VARNWQSVLEGIGLGPVLLFELLAAVTWPDVVVVTHQEVGGLPLEVGPHLLVDPELLPAVVAGKPVAAVAAAVVAWPGAVVGKLQEGVVLVEGLQEPFLLVAVVEVEHQGPFSPAAAAVGEEALQEPFSLVAVVVARQEPFSGLVLAVGQTAVVEEGAAQIAAVVEEVE